MLKKILPHFFTQFVIYGITSLFVGYLILLRMSLTSVIPAYILFIALLGITIGFLEKEAEKKDWNKIIVILLIAIIGSFCGWLIQLLELRFHCFLKADNFTAGFFEDEFVRAYTYIFPTIIIGELMRRIAIKYSVTILSIAFIGICIWFFKGVDRSPVEAGQVLKSDKDHPNIVLILADDLGYNDISLYGNKFVQTPNIDAIGKNGVQFTNAYTSASVCSPSRAGMLTGRYQNRFGFEAVCDPFPWLLRIRKADLERANAGDLEVYPWYKLARLNKRGLPKKEETMAEILKENGYATGIVGKWHLGMHPNFRPKRHGFDYHYGFYNGASLYADINDPNMEEARLDDFLDDFQWRSLNYDIRENGEQVDLPGHPYQTTLFGDKSADFISKNKDNRFFLYASFNAPHAPLAAPKSYYNQFLHIEDHNQRVYYAMIKALDDAVGVITEKLEKEGLLENTLIYFSSDNGGATYTGLTDNSPFKGGKTTDFEGGHVVPFMMQWKGHLSDSTIYEKPTSLLDIFSTSLAVANSKLPSDRKIDGVNLIPYLSDTTNQDPHEVIFSKASYAKFVRKGDYKLFINGRVGAEYLYNLKEDVGETTDISIQNEQKVQELQSILSKWEAGLASPLWGTGIHKLEMVDGKPYYLPN